MRRNNIVVISSLVITLIIAAAIGLIVANSGKDTPENKNTVDTTEQQATQNSSDEAVNTDKVSIENFAFSPADITVKVGTKVTWTNQDSVSHTVTMDDEGEGPDSELLGKGESYSYTFTKTGTYSYHCVPHPNMQGTVTVTN